MAQRNDHIFQEPPHRGGFFMLSISLPDTSVDVRGVVLQEFRVPAPEMGGIDEEIGGGPVAGCRHVIEHSDPQQGLHIHIMGLWLHGIPEEDQDIDLIFSDHCPQLLVTPQGTRFELG